MDSLLELFCHVDDFCKAFLPHWNKQLLSARRPRGRRPSLCMSEIMTILIHFHQSNYRNFKAFYLEHVMTHLRNEFPGLVSYNRFVELIPSVIVPLNACLGTCTGITFIDSTTLAVCKNPRIDYHKTFAGLARRGKTSTGWFYGFKLHLIVIGLTQLAGGEPHIWRVIGQNTPYMAVGMTQLGPNCVTPKSMTAANCSTLC
jgi:hypothetical protein